MSGQPWWREAVCYQVYLRSFADGNGDGVGDIPGVTARLDYLEWLGVDAIWLTPFYESPQNDHGYDVTDYRAVDPLFGTLDDFDEMLAGVHDRGMKVIVDIVPNHSSSEHAWFRQALAARPGSPERARYIFRDGRGDGDEPPNNWRSVFGGSAWTQVSDGQWYLHIFDESQPDFDWTNPEVGDEFESVLRFWLDRGVDGFRVDVAHGMVKAEGLPDVELADNAGSSQADIDEVFGQWDRPYWDQPGVHDIYRRWHRVLAEYEGERMAIGEAWVATPESMARYVRDDELQQVFNFCWLDTAWSADAMRAVIDQTYAAVGPVGATPTWVLSNHDVVRAVSRYGGGRTGLARARAVLLTMLALPGSSYLYYGEELGLPQVDVDPADRKDPTWLRGGGVGRDGCRIPMPWSGSRPPYGFAPDGVAPWLPQPDWFADLTVQSQDADPHSSLSVVRDTLAHRRKLVDGLSDTFELLEREATVLAFHRPGTYGKPGLTCLVNCGETDVASDDLSESLVRSDGVPGPTRWVPPDTAVWFHDPLR